MTDDLIAWLRAQLDEDERVAREADDDKTEFGSGPSSWTDPYSEFHGRSSNPEFAHVLRHSPARVLAEVDAKRLRLDLIAELATRDPDTALRFAKAEVLPFADREGYREEWRP